MSTNQKSNIIEFPVKSPSDELIDRWIEIEEMTDNAEKLLAATKWRDDVRNYSIVRASRRA